MVKEVSQPSKYLCEICYSQYQRLDGTYYSAEQCETQGEPDFKYNIGNVVPLDDGCGNNHLVSIIQRRIVGREHMQVYVADDPHNKSTLIAYPESMLTDTIVGRQRPHKLDPWMIETMDGITNPEFYPLIVAQPVRYSQ